MVVLYGENKKSFGYGVRDLFDHTFKSQIMLFNTP